METAERVEITVTLQTGQTKHFYLMAGDAERFQQAYLSDDPTFQCETWTTSQPEESGLVTLFRLDTLPVVQIGKREHLPKARVMHPRAG